MDSIDPYAVEHTNLPVLIPVILADSCNLDHWPASRISMPIQFQRSLSGMSPFEDVVSNLSKIENLLPPIISLSSHCLKPALEQLNPYKLRDSATLLVAPLDRGSLHCAITATLLAQESFANALMVVIDCAQPPTRWEAFGRLLSQVQQTPLSENSIIACGHPVNSEQTSRLSVERIEQTANRYFYTCKPANPGSSTPTFELGRAVFSTPNTFLSQINKCSPQALTNCNKALQNATVNTSSIWPNFNIWSCLEQQDLLQTLVQNYADLLLRPIELHDPSNGHNNSSDLIYAQDSKNCTIETNGHLIAVAGCENLRIVSTKDATLIVNKDRPECMSPILNKMRSQERPEIYDLPTQNRPWGKETEIERHAEYKITRVEIEPCQSIPRHIHAEGVEFLHVLSGKGDAGINGALYPLASGLSLTVPANTSHTIQNLSDSPLVLLETQHTISAQTPRHSAGINASSPP